MQTQRDELTGLLTMAGFVQELDQAARSRSDWVLAVLDLDHFLSFNEKYGHVCGDEWLKGISARFASLERATARLQPMSTCTHESH